MDILPFSERSHMQTAFYEDKIYNILLQESIEKGKKLYSEKQYEEALDEWEKVLRFDPSNDFIHQKLDELLEKLEKDE